MSKLNSYRKNSGCYGNVCRTIDFLLKSSTKAVITLLLALTAFNQQSIAQGTWTALTNLAPDFNEGVMLLMTDGTVICKTSTGGTTGGIGNTWNKLTPSATGSYVSGTWSTIAAMHDDRLYFSTQILKDGRVYVAGGEYGTGGVKSEVYDPQTNVWTMCPQIVYTNAISDANSEILPNGKVLQALVDTGSTRLNYLYNPATNTYTQTGSCLRTDNEASWIKLPDQSIVFIDNYGTTSERYVPSSGTWINDGTVPVGIYDAFGHEAGPAFLLPDGRGFFVGANGHTAYYTPTGTTSPGTWAAGPDVPGSQGAPDAAGAIMVNGKILLAVSPVPTSGTHFPTPTAFYEFDYTSNTYTLLSAPGGGSSLSVPSYYTNMLCLPDGNILYCTQGYRQYYIYTPSGSALTAGKPTIDSVIQTGCNTFMITGKLFNGISEGASYGDDWQMATNYPVIRLTSGSNVYYARSYNWNRTDVMTGTALDTAYFTTPGAITAGTTYSLVVTANGNPSNARSFTPGPAAISPSSVSVCTGKTTTLTDATTGGTWSSANTAIATIGSTGVVSGVAAGVTVITYTFGSCTATRTVSVNTSPGTITGFTTWCAGTVSTLNCTPTGGTWSSSNTALATIGSSSGICTLITNGINDISYTISNGCIATITVDINQMPAVFTVTGGGMYCSGGSGVAVGLSSSENGTLLSHYQLYNGATAVGSPVTGTGSAISFGLQTVTGTYTVLATNLSTCTRNMTGSAVVSVGSAPGPITGITTVCTGNTTNLGNSTSGGVWSSSSTGIASVGSSTGVVTGAGSGTATITYSLGSGCFSTVAVTVNPSPDAGTVTGTASICDGGTTTLSSTVSGGVWSSSNAAVATVGSGSGFVNGIGAGTAAISYTVSNSCGSAVATKVVTVTSTTSAGSITGTLNVCTGGSTTLSDGAGGGLWSSDNTSVATVGSTTGIVTGTGVGTANISYTVTNTCGSASTSVVVTINSAPDAGSITGSASVCTAATTPLSESASGGSWTSSNTSIATVNSSGVVSGVASGIATISYTVTNSCGSASATQAVTVNAAPSAGTISGATTVNTGASTTLTEGVSGGTWSTSNGNASVTSSGVLTGVTAGTTVVSYTVSNGCGSASATLVVTINTSVSGISGTLLVCAGATTTLTDSVSGGTWSSGNTTVATVVAGTGIVTGVTAGTAAITYSMGGSSTMVVVTVNVTPSAIAGSGSVCLGSAITLSDAVSGGSWTSGSTGIATIDATTGAVTGIATGTAMISYTLPTGCFVTKIITANPVPAAITGGTSVCVGGTSVLSDPTSGGISWTSSDATVATVTSGGVVTAIGVGTSTITYTISNGCSITTLFTVNSSPSAITGSLTVCAGSTTALSSASTGGTWSSANTAVATVGTDGTVTGVAPGAVAISYSTGTGCTIGAVVTVNPIPNAITGTTTVCQGSTSTLADVTSGGAWSSSDASIASVTSGGVLTGILTGAVTISYSLGTGCTRTTSVTVSAAPTAITGAASVCVGSSTTLSNATGGGTWSSSAGTIASISGAGVVTGVSTGTATITYSITAGCRTTTTVTVNVPLAANTGTTSVTAGLTTTLSNTTTGGTWSSSNTATGTVNSSTGVVTGIAAGTVYMTYSAGGCNAVTLITVVSPAATITGNLAICVGSSSALTDASSPGTWASGTTGVATIGSSSGVVTGVSQGTAIITFTTSGGATATAIVSVTATPPAITGPSTVCVGATITKADATGGGTWSSSNTTAGTIDASGIVTGLSAGATVITYSLGGCAIVSGVTVNPVPNMITGINPVCIGSAVTFTDGTAGGAWSSSNTGAASVTTTGVVTGVGSGVTNISYTLATGCYRIYSVNVTTLTANGGGNIICTAASTTFTNSTTGGTWSSSNNTMATIVAATGVATGVTTGAVNITYTLSAGCRAITTATVLASPAGIGGTLSVCQGNTTALTDATTGGTWSTSNAALATVGAGTGVVTGVAAGTPYVTYTAANTCYKAAAVTVKPLPAAIGGTLTVCAGALTNLTDASTPGLSWTSSTPGVGTITGGGVVTGISAGTTTITFTASNSCIRTAIVTVNANAGIVTGPTSVSVAASSGSPVLYTSSVSGGSWTSGNIARATIGAASGLVTGVTAGTVTLTYTVPSGCIATKTITITTPRGVGNIGVGATGMIQMYPNPTSGIINVNSDNAGTLVVFTLEGKMLAQYDIAAGTTSVTLPGGVAAGTYLCRFTADDGSTSVVRLVYEP